MNFHLVISDQLPESGWETLRAHPEVRCSGPFSDREEVLAALASADALIIRSTTRVDAELLDAAPGLKIVARAGARLDNVDMDEATRRGIIVINVPEANIYAVVEHAFALLLAQVRQIPAGAADLARGAWSRHDRMGIQLHGKTIGVIGWEQRWEIRGLHRVYHLDHVGDLTLGLCPQPPVVLGMFDQHLMIAESRYSAARSVRHLLLLDAGRQHSTFVGDQAYPPGAAAVFGPDRFPQSLVPGTKRTIDDLRGGQSRIQIPPHTSVEYVAPAPTVGQEVLWLSAIARDDNPVTRDPVESEF